nr:uncharacterized protein LOC129278127 [Lytechinus pictus]
MDAYLNRFERYAENQGWPQTSWAISLSALLRGKSLDVYSRLSADQAKDYATLKDALLKRFELTADDFRKKFRFSNPEVGETPSQFVVRLSHYLDKWIELSEAQHSYDGIVQLLLMQQVLEKGGQALSLFLKERKPKSADEMAGLADTFVEAHGGHYGVPKKNSPLNHKSKPKGSTAVSNAPIAENKVKGEQSGHRRKGPCFVCNKMGHFAQDCNVRLQGASLVSSQKPPIGKRRNQKNQLRETQDLVGKQTSGSCPTCSSSGSQETQITDSVELGEFLVSSAEYIESPSKEILEIEKHREVTSMCATCKRRWHDKLPVRNGKLESYDVSVLRDTGCSGVIVKKSLILPEQFTGQSKWCVLIDQTIRKFPIARVNIDSPWFVGKVEALCVETPVFDVVLGEIDNVRPAKDPIPNWKPGQPCKSHDNVNMAVQTRAQVREAQRPRPTLKVPSAIPDVSSEDIKEAQMADPTLKKAMEYASLNSKDREDSEISGHSSYFVFDGGLLHRVFQPKSVLSGNEVRQLVVPKPYRQAVLKLAHESIMGGHQGVKKVTDKVLANFYWPGVQADITRYCRSCDICQRTVPKGRIPKVPLGKMPVIDVPFLRVAVDLVGPIKPVTARKNMYILTIVDYATRYPEAVALANIETSTVAEAMVEVFCRVGVPQEILSDRGTQFTSGMMREVGRLLSIRQLTTTPYHPACNGLVERFNQTLKQILKRVCADRPSDWDRYLAPVLFAYRAAPQASLGFSPFELLYGRQVRGPLEILKELWSGQANDSELKTTYQYIVDLKDRLESTMEVAQEELSKSTSRNMRYYNAKSRVRKFVVGDKVLLLLPSDHNKLLLQWKGPFKVVHKLSDLDYRLDMNGKVKTFHANLLKRYIDRAEKPDVPSSVDKSEEDTTSAGALEVVVGASVIDGYEDNSQETPSIPSSIRIGIPVLEAQETIDDVEPGSDLSTQQRHEVSSLLEDFPDVMTDVPGKTLLGSHSIRLTSADPIRQRPYPVPHALRSVIQDETEKMVKMGVIEKSNSPYSSPIVIVKKSDGSNRFCIDFRRLNRITIFDAEPLPSADEIFASLSGSCYFSKVDLSKGYWQIPLSEDAKAKTAFQSPSGLFQFRVMPFGLVNAPATFSRVMRSLLADMKHVTNYLDDILIHTSTWLEHISTLYELLGRLRAAGLTARPSKCQLGCTKVEFLGHIVQAGKIQPMLDKVEKIRDAKKPETKKQLRAFIGLASYYRRFIPNFASKASRLTDKTRNREPNQLKWTAEEEAAFKVLKESLTQSPILCLPDVQKKFILRTDASSTGLGAVLLQEHDGEKQPVAYASRKLLPREQAYSTIERECLGLVWGISKFHVYLEGTDFVLETDHKPLLYLNRAKCINSRVMRWALSLQPFRYRIEAIRGSENVGADFLSRL